MTFNEVLLVEIIDSWCDDLSMTSLKALGTKIGKIVVAKSTKRQTIAQLRFEVTGFIKDLNIGDITSPVNKHGQGLDVVPLPN